MKDKNVPIEDRWEVFIKAPRKKHECFYSFPENLKKLDGSIINSAYDEWYLDRHQTFDVVGRLSDWESEIGGEYGFGSKISKETLDLFKEYYMDSYIGSWENDW